MDSLTDLPCISFCGVTGAGTSALIHALVSEDDQENGVPGLADVLCVSCRSMFGFPVELFDIPSSAHTDLKPFWPLFKQSDLLIRVVGFDSRALEPDRLFLQAIHESFPALPILVVGTGIDRASRNFDATRFDPVHGSSSAEKAVADWHVYLKRLFAQFGDCLLCSAGENRFDTLHQYNLFGVYDACVARLASCENALVKESATLHARAEKRIRAACAAACVIGASPLPAVDIPLLIATQVALILSLASLYKRNVSKKMARSFVLAVLAALPVPFLGHTLAKFVPVWGSVCGAGVASASTYAVGRLCRGFLEKGENLGKPSAQSVRRYFSYFQRES